MDEMEENGRKKGKERWKTDGKGKTGKIKQITNTLTNPTFFTMIGFKKFKEILVYD